MKRVFFTLALAVSLVGALNAQVSGKAIGLRFGGGFGYGAEVNYQHPLGAANRMEFGLGANGAGFGLSGVYQWVWDLSDLGDGFNWYAGVGGGLGSYDFDDSKTNRFNLGVLGQVGLEYNFEIPLVLSVDYRPGIYILNGFGPTYDGICVSARYKF